MQLSQDFKAAVQQDGGEVIAMSGEVHVSRSFTTGEIWAPDTGSLCQEGMEAQQAGAGHPPPTPSSSLPHPAALITHSGTSGYDLAL